MCNKNTHYVWYDCENIQPTRNINIHYNEILNHPKINEIDNREIPFSGQILVGFPFVVELL